MLDLATVGVEIDEQLSSRIFKNKIVCEHHFQAFLYHSVILFYLYIVLNFTLMMGDIIH